MHWAFNNHASLGRSLEVQHCRGITPEEQIVVSPNRAIETADCATMIGNDAVHATYENLSLARRQGLRRLPEPVRLVRQPRSGP
jgi:hypothetical protein